MNTSLDPHPVIRPRQLDTHRRGDANVEPVTVTDEQPTPLAGRVLGYSARTLISGLHNVSIHLGKFLQSTVRMPLAAPRPGWPRTVEVLKTEEKGSDVVVSNDSDLCEPIRIVKDEYQVPVALLIPHHRTSQALMKLSPTLVKRVRSGPLSASLFPASLSDSRGKIVKPPRW